MMTPEKSTMRHVYRPTYRQRFNTMRMNNPSIDFGVFFIKLLVVVIFMALAIRALTGCGGSPFTGIEGPVSSEAGDDGLVIGVTPGDANDAGDAGDVKGAASEPQPEASPEPEASPVETSSCCSHPDPSCSYPLGSCPIASENHGSFPSNFETYAFPAETCTEALTPPECLCDYSCACVLAYWACPQGSPSCTNDPVQGLLISCK